MSSKKNGLTEPKSLTTLYEVEEHLQALLDSDPDDLGFLNSEAEGHGAVLAEYAKDLQESLKVAADKRDRVAWAITHLMAQAKLAEQEIERLQARKKRFSNAAARLSEYVLETIKSLGPDAKGKWRKLEGAVSTLNPCRVPASVGITDPDKVPAKYKVAELQMTVEDWESLAYDTCDRCAGVGQSEDDHPQSQCFKCNGAGRTKSVISSMAKVYYEIRKSLIKPDLESGQSVPGAELITNKLRLEIK